jgi:hypothetical protein
MYLSFLYFLRSDHFQHISWRHAVVECQLFQPWNSASQIDGSQWGIYTPHSSICLCCTFMYYNAQCIQLSNQLNKNSMIAFQFSLFLLMKELILLYSPVFFKRISFRRRKLGNICSISVELCIFYWKENLLFFKHFNIYQKSQRQNEGSYVLRKYSNIVRAPF